MAIIMDYEDATPTSLITTMQQGGCVTINPYNKSPLLTCPRQARANKHFKTITGANFEALSVEDKNNYSPGKLVVAVSRQTTAMQLGLLLFTYGLRFSGQTTLG